jgi:hypothetical protein
VRVLVSRFWSFEWSSPVQGAPALHSESSNRMWCHQRLLLFQLWAVPPISYQDLSVRGVN